MTLLPIVERELRIAARRGPGPRLLMALGAVVVGGVIMVFCEFVAPFGAVSPAEMGMFIFRGLAGLSLTYALFSGRFSTVDCLSSERREGTLGLLFLTDLKGYDVVLGKLAATSVQSFYGLLAVFPALAIPLLMGGVTNGEFWRMIVVLVDTFLFSLAIGVFASAYGRDFRQAAALNFFMILALMCLPPAALGFWDFYANRATMIHWVFFSCPIYTFGLSFDAFYKAQSQQFWQSIGVIHMMTWVLILWASQRVPHSWQDKAVKQKAGGRRVCLYGNAAVRAAFRQRCLDQNAFYWLAARVWSKPFQVWAFMALAALWWGGGFISSRGYWLDDTVYFTTAILLNITFKLWVAIEAGQRMAEDKKAGAFELLLTTPLTAREILGGQLLALRRQFLWPLVVTLVVEFLLLFAPGGNAAMNGFDRGLYLSAGMLMLVADLAALVGVAMYFGLILGNAGRASAKTMSCVLSLPWMGLGLVAMACGLWTFFATPPAWEAGPRFYLGAWVVLGLLTDAYFGWRAWRRLLTRFGHLAEEQRVLSRKEARKMAAQARTAAAEARVSKPQTKRRFRLHRRITIAGLIVAIGVIALRYGYYSRPKPRFQHPPPVLVQLGASNTPMRVSGYGMGLEFVLTDGSLWEWGKMESSKARIGVPERSGTDNDWSAVDVTFGSAIGIKRDGNLWKWGEGWARPRSRQQRENPWQTGYEMQMDAASLSTNSARKWVRATSGYTHYAALMDDGTLWSWGGNSRNELGNGAGPDREFPVRVGTNHDWVDVRARGSYTLALRADGTLWAWGGIFLFWNRQPHTYSLSVPTQVCRETNWAGFVPGSLDLVVNQAGEVWIPFVGAPAASVGASANCSLVYSNYAANRFATAFCGEFRLYQIRDDGTLWQSSDTFQTGGIAKTGPATWSRVGQRSDWMALWSGGNTAFGQTTDGTVWTWGIDLGREMVERASSRWMELRARMASTISRPPAGMGGITVGKRMEPPFESEPWPLMKLIPAGGSVPGR